ncbi:uncharacterized protein ACA1_369590 [Acanthamoeba castellanii str. Neff]|uniref:Uncharacterized protein n=1 Tax=Acanthamoeba castellanii (strain ATCC 30010 / Neff) TaxID=1257118 RepID=L8H1G2_ACACF|nr:uncharacterized protein ACA1_369590 [Acanthamoeba castellanii str. Neff]ELR18216.1 hypothetical protein ACA1_369590 [Acanthamoeba castellanii str. Neff]
MDFLHLFKKGAGAPKEKKDVEEETVQNEGPENEEEEQETDEELIKSVDARYYTPDLDPVEELFNQLPPNFDEQWLTREIKRRERQRELLAASLADRVIKSYGAFVQGMSQVQQVGSDLHLAAFLCKAARHKLAASKNALGRTCFSVLSNYRRTCITEQVIAKLTTMQSIMDVENRAREAADSGDFARAVELCLECRQKTINLSAFVASRGLAGRIQAAYSSVQKSLDSALGDSCREFDASRYKPAVLAYRLIGKADRLLERLQRHWLAALHTESLDALQPYIPAKEGQAQRTATTAGEAQAANFRELCKTLSQDSLPTCLTDLLHRLTLLLFAMHRMCLWHKNYPIDVDNSSYLSEVHNGLERFRKTLWTEMQRKVSALLAIADFAALQLDQFLQILSVLEQFAEIGDSFSQSTSHGLLASIKKQSKEFFLREHKRRLEDLPAILEAETWIRMPVNPSFNALDIKEFKEFMTRSDSGKAEAKNAGFEWYVNHGSPFAGVNNAAAGDQSDAESNGADVSHNGEPDLSRDDEAVNPALYASYVDEGDGAAAAAAELDRLPTPGEEGPVMASSGLRFLQYIGKYLQLMFLLRPISFEIFVGVTHLFQYYVYTVYSFFGKEKEDPDATGNNGIVSTMSMVAAGVMAATGGDAAQEVVVVPRHLHPYLAACLSRIRAQLIHEASQEKRKFAIDEAHLSGGVDTSDANAAALAERVVAAETLSFMYSALIAVKNRLQSQLPKAREQYCVKFYEQTVEMLPHLQTGIYKCAATHMLRYEGFPTKIASCKWDIKDLGMDHNSYVDPMVKEFQRFKAQLEGVRKRGGLPGGTYNAMLQAACGHVVDVLIDGFSRVRKCSFEGRGLMKLDFQTLQSSLKKMLALKAIPEAERLDAFISAFYEPEAGLPQWFRTHYGDYTHKQLLGLVNSLPIKRKQRSEILQVLSDLEKERRTTQPTA